MYPVATAIVAPPSAPAIPPIPTTEPTALRGNMSDVVVNRLHDQPWCAAAANPISTAATQRFVTCDAKTMGVTAIAQISIAVLRARLMVQPRLINADDSQPPPMLPTSAIT